MTPELKLAQFLSSDEDKQKLASDLKGLSVDDLKGILKEANGDMLQYYQDHPEKLKEKQERDAKKEKKSSSQTDTNESRETDAKKPIENEEKLSPQDKLKKADAFGRELAQKGHEKTAVIAFGAGKALGAIGGAAKAVGGAAKAVGGAVKGAPGAAKGAANGVGAFLKKDVQSTKGQFMAGLKGQARPALQKTPVPGIHHNAPPPTPMVAAAPAKKGLSSGVKAGLLAAGGAGVGMAGHAALDKRKEQQKAASVEKVAVINFSKATKAAGDAAKKVGRGAHGAVSSAATHLGNIKDPIGRGAAIGAATGGVGGAVQGFLDPKENPVTGEKHRLKSAVRKGLAGAAAGAPTGALFGAMSKSSSVQKLAAAMEKRALGMAGIGSMAKNFVGSMKPVAQKAMTAAKPMIQNAAGSGAVHKGISAMYGAANKASQMSTGVRAGIGAAAGAGIGAAKGLAAPGQNAQGQQNSRLGSMARGAVGGAALGAGAGAVAPKALNAGGDAAHLARRKVLGM